jgi:hypothetical protein
MIRFNTGTMGNYEAINRLVAERNAAVAKEA